MTGVVSAAETAGKGEISSFNNYGENGKYTSIGKYEVAYGSAITDVTQKLPSTLTATMTTGEEVEVPVTWVCVSDNLGGNSYIPKHEDASAVYTFEAQLGDGYKMAGNLPDDYVMPFATVSYTEGAQELNSQAPEIDTEMDQAMDAAAGMCGMDLDHLDYCHRDHRCCPLVAFCRQQKQQREVAQSFEY